MGLLGNIIRSLLPIVPRPIVERVAARYVAGSTLQSALDTVLRLNSEGACATIDILGESVEEESLAIKAVDDYLELIDAVRSSGVDSSVSVKPTMIGLSIGEALFEAHMRTLTQRAELRGVVLTIDMEDHTTTDATLHVFSELCREGAQPPPAVLDPQSGVRQGGGPTDRCNVGCVLQAYLHRTVDDAKSLPAQSNVRLCKGIYVEPKEIAHKGYQEVRENYMSVLELLLASGHYVGIATHDEWLIGQATELIAKLGLTRDTYEFQMLLGVKPALRRKLIADGHKLRVYVPYGRDWYPYSLRRLRENPQVAVHVLKAMLTGK